MYELIILEIRPRLCSVNGFVKFSNRPDDIKLVLDGKVKIIPFQFTSVVKNSLTLKVNDNHAIFRFATQSVGSGSFNTEVLQNTAANAEFSVDKPLFSVNTAYTCLCKKCKVTLTDALMFKRALPLPSENLDPVNGFVTNQMLVLNSENIRNIDESSKVLLCKSCQNWLGIKYNDSTLKFWLNTVEFTCDNGSITTSALQDVFNLIKGVFSHKLQSST
nr:unnamed protein product [Callosobruchus analis]